MRISDNSHTFEIGLGVNAFKDKTKKKIMEIYVKMEKYHDTNFTVYLDTNCLNFTLGNA